VQKCIRTDDIDEVGDTTHHTFFEMLGNWSLGDYFKEEAIKWSYEFLTSPDWLGLDPARLAVSVFIGNDASPFDQESFDIWKSLGIPEKRIARLSGNWWGLATGGPCGPCSEMFYWKDNNSPAPESFNDDHPNWVEIWNDVFMQFNKQPDGKLVPLAKTNVDTGMGLERTLAVLNGMDDNYLSDLFMPIIHSVEKISGKKYGESPAVTHSIRVITDHIRAATVIMSDDRNFRPSNVEQGYIIRRLLRRAIRHGRQLGIQTNFCSQVSRTVTEILGPVYAEVARNQNLVHTEIEQEENTFRKTLEMGMREFEKLLDGFNRAFEHTGQKITNISGKQAFKLYDTYGFPIEMTKELATEKGLTVNVEEFNQAYEEHQNKSREASQQKFKGGLADNSRETTKLHTATHLLHQALRTVLGPEVGQKGSNITAERLRFDFSWPDKMTAEQVKKVEDLVNEQIALKLPVNCQELTVEEAKKSGALGFFEHKYGEKVKVYTVGQSTTDFYSKEICGGPHVSNTEELGHFKILKEEASSAGIRRIKAIVEPPK
jgi:alanyl-tRNA synthetase